MSETNPKKILRQKMKLLRAEKAPLFSNAKVQASDIFLEHFSNFINYALYYPMGDELSTLPLIVALRKLGKTICLPNLVGDEMIFRRWDGETLQKSEYQFLEPSSDSDIVIPNLILVPLLAFDRQGHRLGYGKGYYDRVLHHLRQAHQFIAVGYAYSFQEVESVFSEPHDKCLDTVVTETKLIYAKY